MSQSASQAAAFYREIAASRVLWTIEDAGGFPAPKTSSGHRAQPFWSSLSRVTKIIATVPAYADFSPVEISWTEFCEDWVPGLTRDDILVGVNWSGPRAVGYDMPALQVRQNVEAAMERR